MVIACDSLVDMVQLSELHLGIPGVHLKFEVTLSLRASLARAANDSERIGIVNLLVELDFRAEKLEIGDAGLSNDASLVELGHNLALVAASHPTDEVRTLEGAAKVALLCQGDVARAWLRDGQLELRYLTKLAREAGRACPLP